MNSVSIIAVNFRAALMDPLKMTGSRFSLPVAAS